MVVSIETSRGVIPTSIFRAIMSDVRYNKDGSLNILKDAIETIKWYLSGCNIPDDFIIFNRCDAVTNEWHGDIYPVSRW